MKTKLFLMMAFMSFSLLNAQAVVGDVITGGIVNYKITAIGASNEVEVSNDNDAGGTITIPAQVEDGGVMYDVTAIGKSAFLNGVLTELILPTSVTHIKESAFQACAALASANLENIVQIDKRGFRECVTLVPTNTTLPNLITTGPSPFDRCNAFTTISVPALTTIGNYLFTQCANLTSVEIPTSLTSIPLGMFDRCVKLESITIPVGVTAIADDAFKGCTGLTSVTSLNSTIAPVINAGAFELVDLAIVELTVPAEAQSLYDGATIWENFKAAGALSTDNVEQDLDFKVYTNSTNGVVVLNGKKVNNAIVSIYDISGKQLSTYKTVGISSEISVSNLASGVYILKVKTETADFSKKFVKQ